MEYYKGTEDGSFRRKKKIKFNPLLCCLNLIYHTGLVICLATILYWVIENQNNLQSLKHGQDYQIEIINKVNDYIMYDLKPRIIIMDRVLAYQLPTAIVKAFEISHTDLRETLEGVVVDLAKLTEVYRALLGFDQDWGLEKNAQRLKCSWSPYSFEQEAVLGNQEYKDYVKHVNASIEHIKSVYGDFADVRSNIGNLFAKITNYINENLGQNYTVTRFDQYFNNLTANINKSINDIEDQTIRRITDISIKLFKMRNKYLQLYVSKKGIKVTKIIGGESIHTDELYKNILEDDLLTNVNRNHIIDQNKRKIKGERSDGRRDRVKNKSAKPTLITTNLNSQHSTPPFKDGNQKKSKGKKGRRKSRSSTEVEISRWSGDNSFQNKVKLDLHNKLIEYLLNKGRRFDILYTSPNQTISDYRHKLMKVNNELKLAANITSDNPFYKLASGSRPRRIMQGAEERLRRMKRFPFIPHLAAYSLPGSTKRAKVKDKNSQSRENENSYNIHPEIIEYRDKTLSKGFGSNSRKDKSDGVTSIMEEMLVGCYHSMIPGYINYLCPLGNHNDQC
ncbi:transmembrane protein [Shaan virus]|uniref:Transmembrane protein n=1 Tax=Shaan virus TaxID=2848072 RepID=A0A346NTM5_9MONO|nr:transmembrane protein [Bat paramyxovirus]AXR70618.1 transmembrane protein [Shaan virus]